MRLLYDFQSLWEVDRSRVCCDVARRPQTVSSLLGSGSRSIRLLASVIPLDGAGRVKEVGLISSKVVVHSRDR